MKKQLLPIEQDRGFVIRDIDTHCYYCGLNTWDIQLRKAKIYHSVKWANEVIKQYEGKRRLRTHMVKIEIDDVK